MMKTIRISNKWEGILALLTLSILIFIVYKAGLMLHLLSMPYRNGTLIQWDAGWHQSIGKGYYYRDGQNNTAFFPLFGYIWHILRFNYIQVSLFNFALFLAGSYLLIRTFRIGFMDSLVVFSFPTAVYMLVPYSEAVFYFFIALFIYSVIHNHFYLSLAALFLAGLARSSAVILIPSLLLFPLLAGGRQFTKAMRPTAHYIAIALLSLITILLIQYFSTGVWFAFIKVQRYWGHHLQPPHIPFTTWWGADRIWLDGLALLVGISSMVAIVARMVMAIRKHFIQVTPENQILLLSFGYLSMVTLYIILLQGHTLFSLNRYVFATPFYVVFFIHFVRDRSNLRTGITAVVLALITWGLCGGFQEGGVKRLSLPNNFLYFGVLTLYVTLHFLFPKIKPVRNIIFSLLFLLHVCLICYLLNAFVSAIWVG